MQRQPLLHHAHMRLQLCCLALATCSVGVRIQALAIACILPDSAACLPSLPYNAFSGCMQPLLPGTGAHRPPGRKGAAAAHFAHLQPAALGPAGATTWPTICCCLCMHRTVVPRVRQVFMNWYGSPHLHIPECTVLLQQPPARAESGKPRIALSLHPTPAGQDLRARTGGHAQVHRVHQHRGDLAHRGRHLVRHRHRLLQAQGAAGGPGHSTCFDSTCSS